MFIHKHSTNWKCCHDDIVIKYILWMHSNDCISLMSFIHLSGKIEQDTFHFLSALYFAVACWCSTSSDHFISTTMTFPLALSNHWAVDAFIFFFVHICNELWHKTNTFEWTGNCYNGIDKSPRAPAETLFFIVWTHFFLSTHSPKCEITHTHTHRKNVNRFAFATLANGLRFHWIIL